ncbi:MAG: hypothetical protein MUC96_30080 [Myxococcaceae bacterium]|nr:hypothetical protein [Myxococcaceae bacterium]
MRRLMLTLLAVVACACDKVDYIEIAPSDVEFQSRGESKNLSARCMSRAGNRAERAVPTWRVKDPEIAEINSKAQLKPKKSGVTEVIAKYDDVEAAIPVRVKFVEKIEVQSPTITLVEGGDAQPIRLKFLGLDGKDLGKRGATYSVKDKTIATIVGGDSVLPLDPGTTTVDIQVDGITASVGVTVEADKTAKKK